MFKKYMIVIFVLIAALSLSMMSFAIDENTTDEEYVHIISPEVGDSGKTLLNDSLFISIYVQSEETLLLSMVKKEQQFFTFEEEVEGPDFVDMLPLAIAQVEAVEEKVTLAEVTIVELSKEEIITSYQQSEVDLLLLSEALAKAESKIVKIPLLLDVVAPLYDPSYKLSDEETENLSNYETLSLSYNKALKEFIKWENRYDKLFETVIFDQKEMFVNPAFPYFEHTVSSISSGTYNLVITNTDGKVIETFEFEVVTEDTIAESIKEENLFSNMFDPDLFD